VEVDLRGAVIRLVGKPCSGFVWWPAAGLSEIAGKCLFNSNLKNSSWPCAWLAWGLKYHNLDYNQKNLLTHRSPPASACLDQRLGYAYSK
jgi:hypothetical protein